MQYRIPTNKKCALLNSVHTSNRNCGTAFHGEYLVVEIQFDANPAFRST
jgi:hypothetical protein